MPLHGINLKKALSIAEETLRLTGESIIMPAFYKEGIVNTKRDGSIVTETDLAAQNLISDTLLEHFPDISFLGEEMDKDEQLRHLEHGRFWCVDPLDGTTNFTTGLPVFATSLALMDEGTPILACIHDPVRGETFTAMRGAGAFRNHQRITVSHKTTVEEAVGFIDFKRLEGEHAIRLATEKFFRSQRNIGSCVLEWAWLATGRAQFIIHGGEKVWDYAAGALLAEEAGCIVSNFDSRSPFPALSRSSPIVAASNRPIHSALIGRLRS